jgi:hypothetical protein
MNNYIYHGSQGLITLPERNVQTFPSGLVRIDRVYACRKTLVDRFRRDLAVGNLLPFDDGAPAIDGAFIFPDPQEVVRDDGFAEFRVSAYGRTNTTGTRSINIVRQSVSLLNVAYTEVVIEACYPTNIALSQLSTPPDIEINLEYSVKNNENIVGVVPLPKNFTARAFLRPSGPNVTAQFLTGAPQITVSDGGVIVEVLFEGQILQYLYFFPIGDVTIRSSSNRNFGLFSEYTTIYGPENGVESFAEGFVRSWLINGSFVGSYA